MDSNNRSVVVAFCRELCLSKSSDEEEYGAAAARIVVVLNESVDKDLKGNPWAPLQQVESINTTGSNNK